MQRVQGASLNTWFRVASLQMLACLLVAGIGSAPVAMANDVERVQTPSALRVVPAEAVLIGPDAVQQLAVEDPVNGRDLTTSTEFSIADESVATVDASGTISASGEGETVVKIRAGGQETQVRVIVESYFNPPPIHFENQIVPIFTKLGCNAGGCHGKSGGQNGFRLSLLGFEPELDFETLVKEGRGRRLFPAAPEQSLLLLKSVAEVPHGGGKRMEPDSHEYRLVRRWIAEGMPYGAEDAPTVARIEIYPPARVLPQGQMQQLVVTAHYTDGSTEDVTRWAQYESNETEVAQVAEGGLVDSQNLSGQAAIMARYQGQVAVFRATVPLTNGIEETPDFPAQNYIDTLALDQWNELGLAPSELSTDAEFLRRAALDLTGTLPSAEEVQAFETDPDPEKRAKLIDRLLDSPEYAAYFATKWADILRNKREGNAQYQRLTFRFHDWIRRQLTENTPYDEFVRQILAANGSPASAPPVVWYRSLKNPEEFVDDSAQVFLGMRLQCAKCHHHPFEKWSQDDYYGFAAFFGRIGRKESMSSKMVGRTEQVIYNNRHGSVKHPKTGQEMQPKGLDAEVLTVSVSEDPRQKLVDWLAEPDNPFFAPAVVNRYWAHFFSRGLVEPVDDLRETNPPTNPALLDALVNDFVESGYDLKHLIRSITNSRLYSLSSIPNKYNAKDKQSFARYYPKRMTAEVLLDAISTMTDVPTTFAGLPVGTRAIELPDESVGSRFLDTFGRPKRETACECERVTDASLSQSLMLLNSNEVQQKLSADNGRAAALAEDPRADEEKVEELFWSAFGRAPSSTELTTALDHLEARGEQKKEAFEDVIWALVNAKEFQFID